VSEPIHEDALSVETVGNATVVTLRPALVSAPWADVERAGTRVVEELKSQKAPRCVVDLSPLTYIGSAQVALIVRIWKTIRSAEGNCAVACPNRVVLDVIVLAGLDKVWTIRPTRATALAVLGGERARNNAAALAAAAAVAVVAAATAAAGAVLLFLKTPQTEQAAPWMQFGGASVAVIAGLACAVAATGWRRWLGIASILVGFSAATTGAWIARAAAREAPGSSVQSSGSFPSTTPEVG
jgi:anti-anti-sigma factor